MQVEIVITSKSFEQHMFKFVVITVPDDGPAP